MNKKILEYLKKIQIEKEIDILLACETGSRAWGFPSPDSDYDVRFIYKHKINWYLSLKQQKDTIEVMYENNEIDLSGWDIKKSLNLLWKSNPPLLERIQSPIIYVSNKEFLDGMQNLSKQSYSKIATMHHYLNMSRKVFADIKGAQKVKLKKLFYALRTSVACKWILDRDEMPPIDFHTILNQLELKESIRTRIYNLIKLKATKSESYLHHEELELNNFIEQLIILAESKANSLPPSKAKIEDLNDFFINTISN